MHANDDILRRKRELHLRIARSRRRIDRRLRAARDEGPAVALLANLRRPLSALGDGGGVGGGHDRIEPVAAGSNRTLARPLVDAASVRRIPAATLERTAPRLDQVTPRRDVIDQ